MTGSAVFVRCRYCSAQVYPRPADGFGHVEIVDAHPCCVWWIGVQGEKRCPACDASLARRRKWDERRRR